MTINTNLSGYPQSIFYLTFLLVLTLISFFGCKQPTEPTEGDQPTTDSLVLSLNEIDLKTARLNLHTANIPLPVNLILTRDKDTVQVFPLYQTDTVLTDSNLILSTRYSWEITWKKPNKTELKSKPVSGRTEDSTSHNFIWKLDTLGTPGSQVMTMDLLSEDNIWVGGKFYKTDLFDSEWDTVYNAMHWDGTDWTFHRIPATPWYDLKGTVYDEIRAIKIFSDSDIWFSAELGTMVHWDGKAFKSYILNKYQRSGTIYTIKAVSSSKMYLGGDNGSLTFWNGSSFSKIETGTALDLRNMAGYGDSLLIGFSEESIVGIQPVIKILNTKTNQLSDFRIRQFPSNALFMLWYDQRMKIIFISTGEGIYTAGLTDQAFGKFYFQTKYEAIFAFIGNSGTDLFLAGAFNFLAHYNGSTWKQLGPSAAPGYGNDWGGVSVIGKFGIIRGFGTHFIRFWHL